MSSEAFQRVNEAYIAAADNAHVAILNMHWAIVLAEEVLIILPVRLLALVLKWWHDIIGNNAVTGRIHGHYSFDIATLERFAQLSDRALISVAFLLETVCF